MDRRDFLKVAAFSTLGLGLTCTGTPALARGIPAKAFPGGGPGRCFVLPKNQVVVPLLDLFKIGPGPSSSHTLAPLRIASNFRETVAALPKDVLARAERFEAHLYGSLSATGRGHRTDRAVLAGLLGQKPETCDPRSWTPWPTRRPCSPRSSAARRSASPIPWSCGTPWNIPFPSATPLVMRLMDAKGVALFEREYYSPGGGFFAWKGEPPAKRGKPACVRNMTEFRKLAKDTGKPLHQLMLENEMDILGVGEAEVFKHLDMVLKTMADGVDLGLSETGLLPGPFEMHRKPGCCSTRPGPWARPTASCSG